MADSRLQSGDELLRRLAAALRSAQLYSPGHPIIARNIAALVSTVDLLHRSVPIITVGIVGSEVVVGDVPVGSVDELGDIARRLRALDVERITIDRGVTPDELTRLVQAIAVEKRNGPGAGLPSLPHVRLGRIEVGERAEGGLGAMATIRQLYTDAVAAATLVWDSARLERMPDAGAARKMIDGLAHAVAENRTALMALTALKHYDNYTFTHMVNVSILTMAQARALGIDGPLLREFGLAALMHDIGKVRTPIEILTKPEKLTEPEFAVMKRHTVDGAEILRETPDMPALAPVVAFEHHLRLDGSGYPSGVQRRSLNLGTMLCSIADVYDAMRSQRRYQQSFPTERILEVLKRNDGLQFDQHLVRRFVQLVGIYPAGNLVRLDTGELAVVIRVHAPDPHRPHVRVITDRSGHRLEAARDVHLWESRGDDEPVAIVAPIDPAEHGIDPLAIM